LILNHLTVSVSSPEKAGVGGSIPSLATTFSNIYKPTSPYYWQLYDALTALT
jgi:hypothetical protein